MSTGKNSIVRHGDVTVTTLPDGAVVTAAPEDTDSYRETAKTLGYGDDTALMCYEHELLHTIVARMLGLPESPVMRAVVNGTEYDDPDGILWREEKAVLALQELGNALAKRES